MGERETGATLHQMVEKPDAGGIVDQQAVPIGPDDTAAEVFAKVTEAAEQVLARALPATGRGHRAHPAAGPQPGQLLRRAQARRRPHRLVQERAAKCTTWCAASPRPIPARLPASAAITLRILRTRLEPNRRPRSGAPGLYFEAGSFFADCGDGKVLQILELEAKDDSAPAMPAPKRLLRGRFSGIETASALVKHNGPRKERTPFTPGLLPTILY